MINLFRLPLIFRLLILLAILLNSEELCAQSKVASSKMTFGKGINFTSSDSLFTMQINGRVQTMFEARNNLNTNQLGGDFLLRRCRINLQGTALDPRFTYRIQIGFAHGDISAANSQEVNNLILRDAMLFYQAKKWLRLGFGQTKLPGNRQRQVSSANLQLVERSVANNNFTLDRDKGFWVYSNFNIKKSVIKSTIAVSSGEGRIISNRNGQMSVSGRLELLPFGSFTNNGDYIEGDQEREQKPKLSIAAVYNYNKGASRTMGQLGEYLSSGATTDIRYYGVDLLFKYRGFSLASEWYNRDAGTLVFSDPTDPTMRNTIISGTGFFVQSGYMVTQKNEIALRYAHINPNEKIANIMPSQQEYVLGFSHYFFKHSLKLQTDLSYQKIRNSENLIYRLSGVVSF